jgi:uncharacterized protein YndB with AHSA1/START domain
MFAVVEAPMSNTGALRLEPRGEREILVTRTFEAPRRLVFDALTKPAMLQRWLFGPATWSLPVCEVDLRVGGRYRYGWRSEENGSTMGAGGTFREVVAPARLVATERFDEPWYPGESVVTFTLEEEAGGTRLTQTLLHVSREARDRVLATDMERGMAMSYDRLAEQLAEMQAHAGAFAISRIFDAPRERVWRAWTDEEQLMDWWGPSGFERVKCTLDLRPGGLLHYCMRVPNGPESWGKFVFREIVAPERLVFVVSFSDPDAGIQRAPFAKGWPLEVLSSLTFTDRGGKTELEMHGVPINASSVELKTFADSVESMNKGWAGTLDELSRFLGESAVRPGA